MLIYPKDSDELSESDIDGVLRSVRRNLAYGVTVETAVRAALITQFGSNEQFRQMMRAFDVEAREARGIA